MKTRYFILFIAILTLSACAQAARAEQLAHTSVPAGLEVTPVATQAEVTNKPSTQKKQRLGLPAPFRTAGRPGPR